MYQNIPFWRFILGMFVILVPAAILERKDEGMAWKYVVLILLTMIVYNHKGVTAFSAFLTRELGGVT